MTARGSTGKPTTVAVVLSGALAKGAFEAGALQVLARANVRVARIVAASAGALNGVAIAAGIRAGTFAQMADELVELWANHAGWSDVFHLRPRAWLPFKGLSDQAKLLALLREHVRPATAVHAPINLRIVTAPLAGAIGAIGGDPATTYEHVFEYDGAAFDRDDTLAPMFDVAAASASFPGAFAPFELSGIGACIDGGSTNNTPIKYALEDEPDIEAIIVIAPTVELLTAAPDPENRHGVGLLGHVGEILINERLYRDLHDAETVNAQLRRLDALCPAQLTAAQLAEVKRALGWTQYRVVDVVRIRPLVPLPGSAFSGFRHAGERAEYLELGRQRALAVLHACGLGAAT
jgi:NTE family protein